MAKGLSTKTLKSERLSKVDPKELESLEFVNQGVSVPASQIRGSVLDLALKLKIEISHSCGGHGTCGTCRVFIDSIPLAARNEIEAEMAADRQFADNERLSCQVEACAGLKIRTIF